MWTKSISHSLKNYAGCVYPGNDNLGSILGFCLQGPSFWFWPHFLFPPHSVPAVPSLWKLFLAPHFLRQIFIHTSDQSMYVWSFIWIHNIFFWRTNYSQLRFCLFVFKLPFGSFLPHSPYKVLRARAVSVSGSHCMILTQHLTGHTISTEWINKW